MLSESLQPAVLDLDGIYCGYVGPLVLLEVVL